MSDGFSDEEVVGVGAFYGLRWFTICEVATEEKYTPEQVAERNRVRDHRLRLWNACKRLADRAATGGPYNQGRTFTRKEQELWDQLNGKMDQCDEQIRRLTGPESYALRLRGTRDIWEPGLNKAVCLAHGNHLVPHPDKPGEPWCGCGYWAYWQLGQKVCAAPTAVGLVKGSGRLIEGSKGFRCSEAEIVGLWMPVYDTAVALELEAGYGADVYSTFGTMKIMFGKAHPDLAQPELGNAWNPEGEEEAIIRASGSGMSWGDNWAGGRRPDESYAAYARRLGLASGLMACPQCGEKRCTPGQSKCVRCQVKKAIPASSLISHVSAPSAVTMGGNASSFQVGGNGGNSVHANGVGGGGGGGGQGSVNVHSFPAGSGGSNLSSPEVFAASVRLRLVMDQLTEGIRQLKSVIDGDDGPAVKAIDSLIALVDAYNDTKQKPSSP